jgi:hypothetical protein
MRQASGPPEWDGYGSDEPWNPAAQSSNQGPQPGYEEPQQWNQGPQAGYQGPQAGYQQPQQWNQEPQAWNQEPQTWDQGSQTWDQEAQGWNQEPEAGRQEWSHESQEWSPDPWSAEPDAGPAPEARGLIVSAVMGFLGAGVAIGVSTLAAAFFRPQASPIIAVGEAFIDRTPPALKNFAVEKFGENDKTMLLLGMYVTIVLLAMTIGIAARRRISIGVVGVAVFGLFGAFVAYTRPASKPTDVIPAIIGGVAGVAALLWLAHAAQPQSRPRVQPRALR